MSLSVLTISPENGKIDVTIDSPITIEFSDPIDPFTLINGVVLYTKEKGIWSGPDLGILDTSISQVTETGTIDNFYKLDYEIIGNIVKITPTLSLMPDAEHFITVYSGNDPTRFVTKTTVGIPIIVSQLENRIDINSSYAGLNDDMFEILVSSSDGSNADLLSVSKGIIFVGDFKFQSEQEVNIGELTFTLTGSFEVGDTISIPVYKGVGTESIYVTKFTTSKYITSTPRSTKIEFVGDRFDAFKIINTLPSDGTVNNKSCNPVIVKFNKPIKKTQILDNKISIKRTDLETGEIKSVVSYFKIEDSTLKIYMISTLRKV